MALKTYEIAGKALYAKIVGKPVPGYDPDSLEWTVDVVLDETNQKKLLESGCSNKYLKTNKDGDTYVRFTRKAVKKDGSPGAPIKIVGPDGKDWGDTLIGNGSDLRVKFTLNPVGKGKDERLKPSVLAIQVWEHVKYTPKSGFQVNPKAVSDSSEEQESW